MAKPQTLGDLRPGQSCIIVAIGGEGAIKRRLVDMGITPGIRVYLRKTAPLGDPLEINLRGYELSLRREDAKNILVEKVLDHENSADRKSQFRKNHAV